MAIWVNGKIKRLFLCVLAVTAASGASSMLLLCLDWENAALYAAAAAVAALRVFAALSERELDRIETSSKTF